MNRQLTGFSIFLDFLLMLIAGGRVWLYIRIFDAVKYNKNEEIKKFS